MWTRACVRTSSSAVPLLSMKVQLPNHTKGGVFDCVAGEKPLTLLSIAGALCCVLKGGGAVQQSVAAIEVEALAGMPRVHLF